jgi:hypothetical protein
MKWSKLLCLIIAFSTTTPSFAQPTMGLFFKDPGSLDGYVLFAPIMSNNTYLIDKCGREVHQWTSSRKPGQSVYLLPDGSLLRPGSTNNTTFNAGGSGGIIERFDWSSSLLWSYPISDTAQCQHHDICHLPNGHILAIVWEKKSIVDALAQGRNPALLGSALWSEKVVELLPSGTGSATIVWEWHVWDHLNQDYDVSLPAYDTINNHPELININYYTGMASNADWLHINAIAYNADLDQVMLSSHNFNEIWVIDHSTTTAEAASHTGGTSNKGGDLLYRWGNPAAYNQGTTTDRKLFGQHNAHWIPNGITDSGKIIVFNNGQGRPGGNHSSIDIIDPPVDGSGNYAYTPGSPFAPATTAWSYVADTPANFYATNISGVQRLSNGNTLICNGPAGTFFEIDAAKNSVWKYINPVNATGPMTQGATPTQNLVFRCSFYDAAYAGFSGHTLSPGTAIEINPLPDPCSGTGLQPIIVDDAAILTAVNPFSETIQLLSTEDLSHVTIAMRGLAGNTITTWQNASLQSSTPYTLVANGLPSGMYILTVYSGHHVYNLKLYKH